MQDGACWKFLKVEKEERKGEAATLMSEVDFRKGHYR